jgi:arabinogalactan endo-1,4-beta-galactosidase
MKSHFPKFVFLLSLIVFVSCKSNDPVIIQGFAKGADVSWVTQMEASNKLFYNSSGTQTECIKLLKNLGANSIRLRVWVNPSDGWCNPQDLLAKAIRASNLGMRIMVDFHYSDTWADPSHQTKPAAWSSLSFTDLKSAVSNHTTSVLNLLKSNNITPEWVQVGNETGNGMLWPDGKADINMANYAALTNAGYDAVKSVFPNAKVVVHLQNGYDNNLFRWLFDGLVANGGKWDVIGMSLYPTPSNWSYLDDSCLTNMKDMITRYGKEVMICEVGMSWDSAEACSSFLADIILKTKSLSNNKGLGVFYWEPESYSNWNNYTLGAFDNSGKPTAALNAFK